MRYEICFWILILASLQFQSCSTLVSDTRPEGVVVERNKQARPIWANQSSAKLLKNQADSRFHFAMLQQRDLPIAVKLSQTNAIKDSFQLWLPGYRDELQKLVELRPLQAATQHAKDLERVLESVAIKLHGELAQIEDIYYERIRIDRYDTVPHLQGVSEYFDVHVMVKIAPLKSEHLRATLANELRSVDSREFKRVAMELSPQSASPRK
jgi:hypothetical protein